MVVQVDEHASTLHAVERHVLHAQVVEKGAVHAAVSSRVVLRTDDVGTGAVAVVVDGLFVAVPVGVERGADMGEPVPLCRVLERERDVVVGPDVDVAGVAPILQLAHQDVEEVGGVALQVLGRRQHRRAPARL